MDYNEIISFVQEIELFQGLSEREFQILSESIEESTFRRGELLFEENGERKDLFLIYDGEVELFKKNVYGEEKRLSFFTRGDFLGEGSWSSDSKHSTSARAVVDTHVLSVKKEYFVENSESALKVLSNVAQVISRRMRHANNRMVNVAAQYEAGETRQEHDLLGYRDVPNQAYYGIQTMRAIENFNISGVTLNFYPVLVESLAMVKKAAAQANHDLGLLDDKIADAITTACTEIANGRYQYHFVVDMIQGGAGTSTNMNANEVIANRALEIMGRKKGDYEYCHPNNHVNLSQSTNDAYPTAIKIALYNNNINLIETLKKLIGSFMKKGEEFKDVLKMGRTQLQDAVPMTLGQNFMAWGVTLEEEVQRLEENVRLFLEINMGATAIGTGINSDPDYADKVVKHLRDITGLDLKNAENLVEATQDTGAFVMYSSAIKRLAVKLSKISNDLRLLSSGPRTGLNEINLPPMQPGSSIMPGKVNPVIPEVVNQVAFKVIGNDLTVTIAAEAGQLELNVMEPVIVQSIFESVEMLKNGMMTLKHRCIDNITANRERCLGMVQNSISIVTALNPVLGYETCSALAKEALETDGSVYDLCINKGLLSKEELDKILSPERMIRPQKMK
ncbi:MAG: aspartate ammonia-lyase [Bacteroidales bacterium]|nr:aspartate ammonia-lyase [Bacteroidales bacterium]